MDLYDHMTNFTTYADRARREGHLDYASQIEIEGRISSRLVKHALASGYSVTVHDGEEVSLICSTKYREIMDELFTTDRNTLIFRDKDNQRVGSVLLIYGNGIDLMSDWAAPETGYDAFEVWLKPVSTYVETLDRA